jgi:hypothetical protein
MAPALPQSADSRWLTVVYFFRLFSCGGPDMAPALPQSADNP